MYGYGPHQQTVAIQKYIDTENLKHNFRSVTDSLDYLYKFLENSSEQFDRILSNFESSIVS